METIQIRLTKKLVDKLGDFVKEGYYPNKSEAVRDAVRRLILDQELGELGEELSGSGKKAKESIPDHVKELRRYCH